MSRERKNFIQEEGNGEEKESKEIEEREEVEEADVDVKVEFTPDISMVIFVNKKGKLEVELKGIWTARLIRAIQLAVIKEYRKSKKEAITKKEE